MHISRHLLSAAATLSLALPSVAMGGFFTATLTPLNDSGVTGNVQITVDETASTLRVQYQASGLTPGLLHPGHIHGLFEGGPQTTGDPPPAADSVSPTTPTATASSRSGKACRVTAISWCR